MSRKHPIAARVLRRWRELTGGTQTRDDQRRTLVACSGGADSTALGAILSLVTPKPVLMHIVHDLRERSLADADRDSCERLASRLGCEFHAHPIQVADQAGNTESNARDERYKALLKTASDLGIAYLATGHHADDQLETMMMNLSRGCGVRGLSGVHDARVQDGVRIIRPMLVITHDEAIEFCEQHDLAYVHDHTNDDLSMTRNTIRHQLLPAMRAINPDIAMRASSTADACRSMQRGLKTLVETHVWPMCQRSEYSVHFERSSLSIHEDAVIIEVIYLCIEYLNGSKGHDRLNQQSLRDACHAIKDDSTEKRMCRVGPIVIEVHASKIAFMSAERSPDLSLDKGVPND